MYKRLALSLQLRIHIEAHLSLIRSYFVPSKGFPLSSPRLSLSISRRRTTKMHTPIPPTLFLSLFSLLPLSLPYPTLSPPPLPLSKRTSSLIMGNPSTTPASYNFYTSTCNRAQNSTSWTAVSRTTPSISQVLHSPLELTESGSCAAPQICVDGIVAPGPASNRVPVAFCADPVDKIDITGPRKRDAAAAIGIPIPYAEAGGGAGGAGASRLYGAVEAVFSGTEGLGEGMVMDFVQVIAQEHDCTPQACTWTTLKVERCEGCSSLGIQPVPEGTSRVLVLAGVPRTLPRTEEAGAVLWWNSL